MAWIVVAIVIILILIILILIPKAFKPYKKIGPSVAKHTPNILIKLYVVLAIGFALIMFLPKNMEINGGMRFSVLYQFQYIIFLNGLPKDINY